MTTHAGEARTCRTGHQSRKSRFTIRSGMIAVAVIAALLALGKGWAVALPVLLWFGAPVLILILALLFALLVLLGLSAPVLPLVLVYLAGLVVSLLVVRLVCLRLATRCPRCGERELFLVAVGQPGSHQPSATYRCVSCQAQYFETNCKRRPSGIDAAGGFPPCPN